tara:strand:- start:369 stop:830 length:462 start_codon:yes stop_codon:yes gene_type:complete
MDHICAITGSLADDDATVTETGPLGWIKITIERQVPNPEYVQLQQLKASMVEQQFGMVQDQIPEGDPNAAAMVRLNVEFQIRAMFSALEAEMDQYVSQYEEAYISPPEADEDVLEVINSIRDSLGLMDNIPEPEDDDSEEVPQPQPDAEPGES